MTTTEPVISTQGLGLRTHRGWVYRDIDLEAGPGGVTALLGPTGSGKTALILSLSGRMRFTHGAGRAAGYDLARERRRVSRCVGIGTTRGVNDLDDALTAGTHAREALLIRGTRGETPRTILNRVGIPDVEHSRVGDLDAEERMRLGIALGLVGAPTALLVDDVDHDLDIEQQRRVTGLLSEIADSGVTVLFGCINAHTARLADTILYLEPASRPAEMQEVRREIA